MSKKAKFLIIIGVFLLLIVGFVLYLFLTPPILLPKPLQQFVKIFEKQYTQADNTYQPIEKTIIYYPADYSENIFEDQEFVDLMNLYALEFIDGDSRYKLQVEDLEQYGGDLALFFYKYFNDIRHGDHEAYNAYFDSRAFNTMEKAGEFTQQQIYEISIEQLGIRPELDQEEYGWVESSGIDPIYVDVRYKIRKNNGSFRVGVNSDSIKPQLYIMYKTGKTYKIISIVDYTPIYL